MKNYLIKIYGYLSKFYFIRILKKMLRCIYEKIHDIQILRNIRKMEKSKDNICNVAFIVLFGANWNSYKTVYESLLSFDKVNVQVYVCK